MPKKLKLSDFRPQKVNANSHSERGLWALEESISNGGWIGAITTSADGECFDGSARIEKAYDLFGDEVEPIVVEIDGTRPVIMKRIDIATADDPKAKLLALNANRVAELNLSWNPEVLAGLDAEVDLSGLFTGDELKGLVLEQEKLETEEEEEEEEKAKKEEFLVAFESKESRWSALNKLTELGYACKAVG